MNRTESDESILSLLNQKVIQYNHISFVSNDPISVPHGFKLKQDIEIAGFFTSLISWGQRGTIIRNAKLLMQRMDHAPYEFICWHTDADLKRLEKFVHRTFNATDLLYLVEVLKEHYKRSESMEDLFMSPWDNDASDMKSRLTLFHNRIFDRDYAPQRTRKHIATPERNSACKRLNMFLRWMVRRDESGVDFGIWSRISSAELMCPLDVHVHRVALQLGLMTRTQADWKATEELTQRLKLFCAEDPVKYDYALFGMGIESNRNKGLEHIPFQMSV